VRLSGQLIGVMCLETTCAGRAWEPDEIAFAGGLADQWHTRSQCGKRARRGRHPHSGRKLMQLRTKSGAIGANSPSNTRRGRCAAFASGQARDWPSARCS